MRTLLDKYETVLYMYLLFLVIFVTFFSLQSILF